MPPEPVPADPPPDPMSAAERAAWLDRVAEQDEPPDLEEWPDPEEELTAAELAEIREAAADEVRAAANAARLGTTGALAAAAASLGRRGPGQPGSAYQFPGESSSRAAAFGTGMALDIAAGCAALAGLADQAAGDEDRYEGASDDELIGVPCAWDRLEAHMAARKHAAVAELIRRPPDRDCALEGPARMPAGWDEFTPDELALVLAESRARADDLLTVTLALETKLPGTKAALRDGTISLGFAFTAMDEHGPPGGYRTWRLSTGAGGADLIVALDPISTQDCDHRFQARGHDPGVRLRHLAQVRHATCTGPTCRRPAANCDFEHNTPFEAGGRTCLCNGGPKCKR